MVILYPHPNFLCLLFPLIHFLSHHLHSYKGRVPLNPALRWLFSESRQCLLCGFVVLDAKQSRRQNAILGSLNYIYFSRILGLELPRRNNGCFVEKAGVGGLDVKATHSAPGQRAWILVPKFAIHLNQCELMLSCLIYKVAKWEVVVTTNSKQQIIVQLLACAIY